jgi:hypothetical protein
MLDSHKIEIAKLQRDYPLRGPQRAYRYALDVEALNMTPPARAAAMHLVTEICDAVAKVDITARCPRCLDAKARGGADEGPCRDCPGTVLRDAIALIFEVHAGTTGQPTVDIEWSLDSGGIWDITVSPPEADTATGRPDGDGPPPLPRTAIYASVGDARYRVVLEVGMMPRIEQQHSDLLGAPFWLRSKDADRYMTEILAESVQRTLEVLDHRRPDGHVLGGPRELLPARAPDQPATMQIELGQIRTDAD